MRIQVTQGLGSGPTELAAFDQALVHAGIANFNLIYLSSVLPPKSIVTAVHSNEAAAPGTWGDRLYVVMAQRRTATRGQAVWVGIGWIQDEATGAGLLVEHEGDSEADVRRDIRSSLEGLAANRSQQFGPIHMSVAGVTCRDQPVCALVAAVFKAEPWRGANA